MLTFTTSLVPMPEPVRSHFPREGHQRYIAFFVQFYRVVARW